MKSKLTELGGKEIWANTEQPIEIRAPENFLFVLKKQLVEWGFERRCVRVDIDGPAKTLKVGGETVLTVTCTDGRLVCEWEAAWQLWNDLHESPQFKAIFEKCSKMLAPGKGQSKGKSKNC